jgi:ribosome-binding protein aMBF1 (putative translation factor)
LIESNFDHDKGVTTMIAFDDFLKDQLRDPDFRADWERTALARAVAIEVIKYRTDHGLSQAELARRLGVSQAVVGRLELGEHEPKIATLRKLARTLGLRFSIEVHPESSAADDFDDATVERVASDGVELVVKAG